MVCMDVWSKLLQYKYATATGPGAAAPIRASRIYLADPRMHPADPPSGRFRRKHALICMCSSLGTMLNGILGSKLPAAAVGIQRPSR